MLRSPLLFCDREGDAPAGCGVKLRCNSKASSITFSVSATEKQKNYKK